jgi:hypothetical protein
VRQQLLRYGAQTPGSSGRAHVRDFLQAEMGGLAEDLTVEPQRITSRFFMSDERRRVLAARSDDAAAVAVLVELARSLIASPVPPRFGVDIAFLDPGADVPAHATTVGDVCPDDQVAASCTPSALAAEAARLRTLLDTPPPAV